MVSYKFIPKKFNSQEKQGLIRCSRGGGAEKEEPYKVIYVITKINIAKHETPLLGTYFLSTGFKHNKMT